MNRFETVKYRNKINFSCSNLNQSVLIKERVVQRDFVYVRRAPGSFCEFI